MRFPAACAEIPAADLSAALAYYHDRLGFTVDWSDESLGLAGLSQGAARLFIGDRGFRAGFGNNAPVVLWLNMSGRPEVDLLHEHWRESGANIVAAPEAKPYKLYEFLVRDPDGNILRVFYDFGWEEND